MITPNDIVLGAVFPALLAIVVLALGQLARWPVLGALAAAAGFVLGYAMIFVGAARWPPPGPQEWLFWSVVPLGVLAAVEAWVRPARGVRGALRLALTAAVLALSFWPRRSDWGDAAFWAIVLGLATAITAIMELLDVPTRHPGQGLLPGLGVAAAWSALSTVVIGLSSAAGYSMLSMTLCALSAAAVVALRMGLEPAGARGVTFVVGLAQSVLIVAANRYADLTLTNALLLSAGPVAGILAGRLTPGWWAPWGRWAVRLGAALVPMAIAAALAAATFIERSRPGPGGDANDGSSMYGY